MANGARFHERHRRYEVCRGEYIGDFPGRYLSLCRFSATLSKSRKIEGKCGVAAFSETLRVDRGHLFFNGQPRTGHDNRRLPGEPVLCVSVNAASQWYTVTEEEHAITIDHGWFPIWITCFPGPPATGR